MINTILTSIFSYNPKDWIFLLFLLILAAITVHTISWCGSVLHSVTNSGRPYAVFTFRADQDKGMSTNVLMNILIPNIILILLSMFCYHVKELAFGRKFLIVYVVAYYVYRAFLICILLNRRELYNVRYELLNAVLGIGVACFLMKYFLCEPEKIFIPASELVNEFWLVVIAVVYKFMTVFLDKVYTQKKVVSESRLDKYISNRFNYFYKKYKDIIQITENDNRIWILLFSIMIFENYNRGKFKRKLERIKVRSGRHTTVGIMQVGSDADLTDEESINLAYFKLKDEIVRGNIVTDDEGEINHYAFQYNPDEDYARSITYIYQRLCGYQKSTQRFYIAFHLEEHPEEESPVDPLDEAMMSFGEPKSYLTFDDVRILTGLSKKELKKKLKEKQIVAMYDEDAVRQAFDEDIC